MSELLMWDLIGWVGNLFILIFYWYTGQGKARQGYKYCIIGSLIWLGVGIFARLSSLVLMEVILVGFCLWGMWKHDRKEIKD